MRALLIGFLFFLLMGCTKVIINDLHVETSKGAVIKIKHLEYYNQDHIDIRLSGYGIEAGVEKPKEAQE